MSGSAPPSGPLSHPLFSDSIAAATSGEFNTAFKGLAALIDDDEEQDHGSPAPPRRNERPTSVPLEFAHSLAAAPAERQLAQMHGRAPSSASASGATTPIASWTRPSAIRLAKQRAAAQIHSSARKHTRATPYERHAHSGAAGSAAAASSSSSLHAPTSPTAATAASHSSSSDGGTPVGSSSDYRPIRAHAPRRSFKPTSSSSSSSSAASKQHAMSDAPHFGNPDSSKSGMAVLLPRRSVSHEDQQQERGGGRGGGDSAAASSSSFSFSSLAAAPAQLADTHSSGEATMLLKMWKM